MRCVADTNIGHALHCVVDADDFSTSNLHFLALEFRSGDFLFFVASVNMKMAAKRGHCALIIVTIFLDV